MNTTTNSARGNRQSNNSQNASPMPMGMVIERHYDGLSQEPIVEHLTIPGFLRSIAHQWSLEDIRRFGNKVGQVAEAMQLAYMTAMDASLGVLRAFPVPMMRRVYNIERPIFGWPALPDGGEMEGDNTKLRRQLKETERTCAGLREMIAGTDDAEAALKLTQSLELAEAQATKLKAQLAQPTLPKTGGGN